MKQILNLVAAGAVLASLSVPAAAETPAEFYKGKTVTILVGSPPGGGYDVYARMLAPHLEKKLGATVVVENRPGGSGLLALNQLYAGKNDGLTLMHASAEGALLSQLTEREGARWDVNKLNWLARTGAEPKLWFFGAKSGLKTVEDAKKKDQLTWSATGPTDNISDVAAIVSSAAGLNSKIITGYKGARDMSLAVVNGEVDSGILSGSSALKMVKAGQVVPVAVISRERWKELPDTPTIFEAVKVPADKAWMIDFREAVGEGHRAMVTAPGVPEDRVAYLRKVWGEILTDPAVIEEGAKSDRDIVYMPGEKLQALIAENLKLVEGKKLEDIRQVLLKTYF